MGSGAADIDCTGGGCGLGQYGSNGSAAAGDAFELTFSAKAPDRASYANGLLRFRASDAGSAPALPGGVQVEVYGPDFIEYRLVLEATDASTQTVDAVFNAGDGDRLIVDNVCLRPFTPQPVVSVTDNLIDGGDFEGTQPLTGEFGANFDGFLINDPATGLTATVISADGYRSGLTPRYRIVAGEDYTLMADYKYLAGGFANVRIRFYDNMGSLIEQTNNYVGISGSYQSLVQTYTAPAGAATVEVQVEAGADGESEVYFAVDNLALVGEEALPVTLSAFDGMAMPKYNKLMWETASEENTKEFHLERSLNGQGTWVSIATLSAAGNSDRVRAYEATDEQPFGTTYYRVRSVDFDGFTQTSQVIRLTQEASESLRLFPNPVGDVLHVSTNLEVAGQYELLDGLGRQLRQGAVPAGGQLIQIDMSDLPTGRYIVRMNGEAVQVIK